MGMGAAVLTVNLLKFELKLLKRVKSSFLLSETCDLSSLTGVRAGVLAFE